MVVLLLVAGMASGQEIPLDPVLRTTTVDCLMRQVSRTRRSAGGGKIS